MIAARRASWEASKRRSTLKSNKKRPPLLLRRSRGTEYALKLPDIKDRPGSMMRGSRVLVSIREEFRMTSAIRALRRTGLIVGAAFFAGSSAGAAQGKAHQKNGAGHPTVAVEHRVPTVHHNVSVTEHVAKPIQTVYQAPGKVERRKAVRKAVHRRTVRRERVLCEDGTWSTAGRASCASHGAVAARYTVTRKAPTPRASARARERASMNSAVYRSTLSNTNPRGAIARCNDGTYWHSTTRRNACAGHGGVARWL